MRAHITRSSGLGDVPSLGGLGSDMCDGSSFSDSSSENFSVRRVGNGRAKRKLKRRKTPPLLPVFRKQRHQ